MPSIDNGDGLFIHKEQLVEASKTTVSIYLLQKRNRGTYAFFDCDHVDFQRQTSHLEQQKW